MNIRHTTTAQCAKRVEQKRRWLVAEEMKERTAMAFQAYSSPTAGLQKAYGRHKAGLRQAFGRIL